MFWRWKWLDQICRLCVLTKSISLRLWETHKFCLSKKTQPILTKQGVFFGCVIMHQIVIIITNMRASSPFLYSVQKPKWGGGITEHYCQKVHFSCFIRSRGLTPLYSTGSRQKIQPESSDSPKSSRTKLPWMESTWIFGFTDSVFRFCVPHSLRLRHHLICVPGKQMSTAETKWPRLHCDQFNVLSTFYSVYFLVAVAEKTGFTVNEKFEKKYII